MSVVETRILKVPRRARPGSAAARALGLVLLLAVSACAMQAYEGPERPEARLAGLEGWSRHGVFAGFDPGYAGVLPTALPRYRHQTAVYEIDGRRTGWARRIYLLPGRHVARVEYQRLPEALSCRLGGCVPDFRQRGLTVAFTARAGRAYRIKAERKRGRTWVWVEDVTETAGSGPAVGGARPPTGPAPRVPSR